MKGERVVRKAGWDTHGLPVEIEVEKLLGLDGKDQIEEYGVDKFNKQCYKSVFKYLDEWHDFTRKLGYWLDLDDPYVTCTNEYIESVWWILKQFWDQDMLYEGHKIIPYCARCGTSLSSHEVSQGYKDVSDPSIFIKLKLTDEDAFFLVWTTTPWTLISNVALAVGPEYDYARVSHKGDTLILAEELLGVLDGDYELLGTVKGHELVGKTYEPCFPWFKDEENAFRVIARGFRHADRRHGDRPYRPRIRRGRLHRRDAGGPALRPAGRRGGKVHARDHEMGREVHQGRRSRDHRGPARARHPLPGREHTSIHTRSAGAATRPSSITRGARGTSGRPRSRTC